MNPVKRRGFVSPARAARMLGIHRNTAYKWAKDAAEGEASKFAEVKRHPVTGYLAISIASIDKLKTPKTPRSI